MTRPPSEADRDLELRLRALGIELAANRIQRLREVGLLLAPEPRYPGGGGSTGRYPAGVVERVREAIELADKHPGALYIAALEMFGRGNHRLDERKLKRHLLHVFDRFEHDLRDAAGASSEMDATDVAVDGAEALAKRLARDPRTREMRGRIARRSKRNTETRLAVLTDVIADLASIFLAGAPLSHDVTDLVNTLGFPTALTQTGSPGSPSDPVEAEWFAPAQVDDVRSVVRAASLEQLEQARDEFKAVLRCAAAARKLYRPAEPLSTDQVGRLRARSDLDYALGAVVVAVWRSSLPDEIEQFIALARATTPELEARTRLVSYLPESLSRLALALPTNIEQLTSDEHQVVVNAWAKFEHDHPRDAELLNYNSSN